MCEKSKSTHSVIKKESKIFIITLIGISMLGLVGSDIYLPLLPAMSESFNQNSNALQLILSIYLIGISIGQLFYGPLKERFGRINILKAGLAIFGLAFTFAALSTSDKFLFARLLQSLGATSGLVIGRAIIGDLFSAREAGKMFSTIFPFVSMSPAIAPLVGDFIGHAWGWRATFIFITFFALFLYVLVIFCFRETLASEKVKRLNLVKILSIYPKLLIDQKFILYASAPCFAYIAYSA